VRDPRFGELDQLIAQERRGPGRPRGSGHPNGPQHSRRRELLEAHAEKMRARPEAQRVLRSRQGMIEWWRRRRAPSTPRT